MNEWKKTLYEGLGDLRFAELVLSQHQDNPDWDAALKAVTDLKERFYNHLADLEEKGE